MYYYVVFNGFHVTEQKITSYSKNDKVRDEGPAQSTRMRIFSKTEIFSPYTKKIRFHTDRIKIAFARPDVYVKTILIHKTSHIEHVQVTNACAL